jgi:hypothetical protein
MAEIDVVKKPSRTWLWVVLALVLAVVLWMMFAAGGDSAPAASLRPVLDSMGLAA